MTFSPDLFVVPPPRIGALIRSRRQALGLSRAQLATLLSATLGARDIADLEADRIPVPCWSLLQAISQCLELPLETLLAHGLSPAGIQEADNDLRAG